MKAACAGDVDSFRVLYERYYAMALGIARSRLTDHHLAEDSAQEAFAIACRKLPELKDGSRFPQWLGTICRRTSSRTHRRAPKAASLQQEAVAPEHWPDDGDTKRVRDAVARLTSTYREVIELHYFSRLPYEEIARVLGISADAVHGRMQRARRKLARHLSKREVE